MAKIVFKEQTGNTPELFPINIFDRIPSNHPVRLVDAVVNALDISDIIKEYKGGGTSAYHPRMMLKVLFYSYLSNIYSCRKIAKALTENIHFMYISGNSTPDFRTINNFRSKILKKHIHKMFSEVVKMLVEMGYVSLDVQYIDGTKLESKSNKYTFVWRGSVEKYKEKLEVKINSVLSDIESSIKEDNKHHNKEELPRTIHSKELKERLSSINSKLKEPTKKQAQEIRTLQDKHLPKLEKYEKDLEILGTRNSYSKTDKDATFMRLKEDRMLNGQLKPAYNVQISTENQFVTEASIHQKPNDTSTLESHLNRFEKSYGKQSKEVVADSGYGSEENYEILETKNIIPYVKYNYFHKEQTRRFRNNPFLPSNLFYNKAEDFYICPMGQKMLNVGSKVRYSSNNYISQVSYYQTLNCTGCPLRSQCYKAKGNRKIEINHRLNELKSKARDLLLSPEGLKHRSNRSIEPEAVFGQLKSNNNFNRFTFVGIDKVEMELLLMVIGHNLRKMVAKDIVYRFFILKNKNNTPKHLFLLFLSLFQKNKIYIFKNENQKQ